MSDVKLFRHHAGQIVELSGSAIQVEKSLQTLFESNLEALLGVRLVASERSTGPVHGGRIDTLGLDEDFCPVIIEYKRSLNENVINQGLFYLDWLMDHQKEFQWLVLERLGAEAASAVDWSGPRLLCIAGDYTRYDEYAVRQINRNIELLRYKRFNEDLLLLELVHTPKQIRAGTRNSQRILAPDRPVAELKDDPDKPLVTGEIEVQPPQSQRLEYRLSNASPVLRDLYDSVCAYLSSIGEVQVKELKYYVAFKRIKNFACVELYPSAKVVMAYVKVDPETISLEPGFTRDVRAIGHTGTGDLEISIKSPDDLTRAQPLFMKSYERS